MASCSHSSLLVQPSRYAEIAGYAQVPIAKRLTAAATTRRIQKRSEDEWRKVDDEHSRSFPAPLVLPEDDLAYEPEYEPQNLLSWIREKERNEVTPDRRTLYVAGVPKIDVPEMKSWHLPVVDGIVAKDAIPHPSQKDVIDYLAAFYHGMEVKPLPSPFRFGLWEDAKKKSKKSQLDFISLNRNGSGTRIRTRPCPDGQFERQLNLEDILDCLIDNLPNDAYSVILLVDQDIYEDVDDDFCCGRAYGGSRISVVSMARYSPTLDAAQNAETVHAWPASHCSKYIESCCSEIPSKGKKQTGIVSNVEEDDVFPLLEAVRAHTSVHSSKSAETLAGLWLGRVCKTASHELGHCMGMDHCVYYACIMQSTASCAEDNRQPPYLCPVDLAKILKATGADEAQRYKALLEFCQRHNNIQLFAAFGGWLTARLRLLAGDDARALING